MATTVVSADSTPGFVVASGSDVDIDLGIEVLAIDRGRYAPRPSTNRKFVVLDHESVAGGAR